MGNRCSGFHSEYDVCSGTSGQFPMPADKIGMEVSFDNVFDLQVMRGRFFNVMIDVTLRIHDGAFALRRNQI